MPLKDFPTRTKIGPVRDNDILSVHGVIFFSVVKLLFNPATNFDFIIFGDRNVSMIQKCVVVLPEEDAVIKFVRSSF